MNSRITFHSFLATYFEDYLLYRTKVGFTCGNLRWFFSTFDRFVLDNHLKWPDLTSARLLAFRQTIEAEPTTVNKIVVLLRGFFDYLLRIGKIDANPASHIPAMHVNAYVPFIFTAEEIEKLLKAVGGTVGKKSEYDFLRQLSVYTAIMLMARCGMRISEPLRLKMDHYRDDDRTLYIEKTKFNKDRLIPIPKTAWVDVENYLAVRHAMIGSSSNPYFLVSDPFKGLKSYAVYRTFHQGVRAIGLAQPDLTIGNTRFSRPKPHSLRHSLAVNTLEAIRKRGRSAQNALPVLAAYLGHSDYRYTMKYLKVIDAAGRKALVDFCIFRGKKEVHEP